MRENSLFVPIMSTQNNRKKKNEIRNRLKSELIQLYSSSFKEHCDISNRIAHFTDWIENYYNNAKVYVVHSQKINES